MDSSLGSRARRGADILLSVNASAQNATSAFEKLRDEMQKFNDAIGIRRPWVRKFVTVGRRKYKFGLDAFSSRRVATRARRPT